MSLTTGIGFSKDPDLAIAAKNAAYDAKLSLEGKPVDFAICYLTPHYDAQKAIEIIINILDTSRITGATTATIILREGIIHTGIAVLCLSSKEIKFTPTYVNNITRANPQTIAAEFYKNCPANTSAGEDKAFLYFLDGFVLNNESFIRETGKHWIPKIPVLGFGTCDQFRFFRSQQIYKDNVLEKSAAGFKIQGNCQIAYSGDHGWKPLGKPRVVDRAKDNVIHLINGHKASDIYRTFFQDKFKPPSSPLKRFFISYPLGIRVPGTKKYIIRNAVDILKDGSIVCQGDIPEGAYIHLMISNKESLQMAVQDSIKSLQTQLKGKEPKILFIFESLARMKLIGRNAFSEIKSVLSNFNPTLPVFGMYNYGASWPLISDETQAVARLQNQNITLVAIA